MTSIKALYQTFLQYPVITIDSRKCQHNALFFALKGLHVDGNDYALDALKNGCATAVIDDPHRYDPADKRLILVEDTLTALQQLAAYHRMQLEVPVFAITGTNGKTTTKELVALVLGSIGKVTATSGNYNNHIGVPLTVLAADKDTRFLVVEMGANHPHEIEALCRIAHPTAGLITNIGKAHLEGFGSLEKVTETKAELYRFLREKRGTIILNADNPRLQKLIKEKDHIVSYGLGQQVDVRFSPPGESDHLTCGWYSPSGWRSIKTNMYGSYNFENIMAAVAVGVWYGAAEDKLISAISSYTPDNARSQVLDTQHNHIILDAYNANPTSVRMAVETFLGLENQPKALILGDMFELGKYEDEEHEKVCKQLQKACVKGEKVFLVGKAFYRWAAASPFMHFPDTRAAKEYLKLHPLSGYTILVKGSRGMAMETLIPLL